MKYNIENIETPHEGEVVYFYIETDCGIAKSYFANEVMKFFKEERLVKKFDIGVYKDEVYGTIDVLHLCNPGLDNEKESIEELTLQEFIDENYSLFEWFLEQRLGNK
jgi:hypothetical protein